MENSWFSTYFIAGILRYNTPLPSLSWTSLLALWDIYSKLNAALSSSLALQSLEWGKTPDDGGQSPLRPERVEPETLVPFSLTLFSSLFTPESSLNWSSSSSSSSGGCREITVPSESVMPGPTTTCKYVQHILMKKYPDCSLVPPPAGRITAPDKL